jgi:diguanylate cyclase (GGDEF)-like protein
MRIFHAYLATALAVIVASTIVSPDGWAETSLQVLAGVGAAAAIVAGAKWNRSPVRRAWLLFAAGIALNALGSLAEAIVSRVFHAEPFPGVADILYLALYPALVGGALVVIRKETTSRDWGAIVDSTTITTGVGLLSWVFVIRPAAVDPSLGTFGHVVSIAYPVGDILVLAMLVRLLVRGGTRNASYRLMTGSLLLFLAGDAAWTFINYIAWEPPDVLGRALSAVFLLAYACFALAALHPSMREVGEPRQAQEATLNRRMLGSLTSASLVAPGLLAVQVAQGRVTDGLAIAVGSVALFLLVVTRMAQLLRRVEAQAVQLRELARVDELTGLPNRRAWSAELPRAMERSRRDFRPLSVALLDLDHFKRFNDEFGHPAGDRLLKGASAAWRSELRSVDELVRYGGEEFIVLLPAAAADDAAHVIERLQAVTPAGQTFSAGIATWDTVETSDELVARADRSLYRAKAQGRDRVVVDALV